MKIDSKELRIGNSLYYCGVHTYVISLSSNEFDLGYFTDSIGFTRRYDNNDIQPIELTEGWLVKLGLIAKKDRNNTKWTIPNKLHGNIMYYPLVNQYIYLYHGMAIHLESVHQLQNLFFMLTGEELSI